MIYSMTGYAARTLDVERGVLHIELKSVNSRYLDFQFRIGEELRAVELPLRDQFSTRLTRGKIECRLGFSAQATGYQALTLNTELLQRLKGLEAQIRTEMPTATPFSINEVLRWPGMFGDDSLDMDTLLPKCLELARQALEDFMASRAREGQTLPKVIL